MLLVSKEEILDHIEKAIDESQYSEGVCKVEMDESGSVFNNFYNSGDGFAIGCVTLYTIYGHDPTESWDKELDEDGEPIPFSDDEIWEMNSQDYNGYLDNIDWVDIEREVTAAGVKFVDLEKNLWPTSESS